MQSSPCAFLSIRKSWCSKAHTVRYSTGFTEWTDTSALPLATCSWSAPQREEHRQFTRGGGEGEGGAVPHAQCRLLCAFCWRPARSLSLQRDRVRSKSPSYSLKPLDRSLANGCTSESVCYWLWKLVSQVTVSLLRAVVLPAAQVTVGEGCHCIVCVQFSNGLSFLFILSTTGFHFDAVWNYILPGIW